MSNLKAPTLKNVARYLHRYLGLAVGAPVFVFCASACVLLVRPEVERFLEPERYYAASSDGERLPLDSLLERLIAAEKAELGDADVVATRVQIPWQMLRRLPRKESRRSSGEISRLVKEFNIVFARRLSLDGRRVRFPS